MEECSSFAIYVLVYKLGLETSIACFPTTQKFPNNNYKFFFSTRNCNPERLVCAAAEYMVFLHHTTDLLCLRALGTDLFFPGYPSLCADQLVKRDAWKSVAHVPRLVSNPHYVSYLQLSHFLSILRCI